jgi:REP element-mobilizing transposase RayT
VVRPRTPVHLTLRVAKHVWNLRTRRCFSVIHRAFCKAGAVGVAREGFRLIHYSVQGNHLHLLVEADDRAALMRGAKGLSVRLARALNGVMGRNGHVFADRYHVQLLTGPARVRWALRYVLCNARKHASQRGERYSAGWLDPFSSARFFDGWRGGDQPEPSDDSISHPRSWLLTAGWRKRGLIAPDEVPSAR